MLQRVHAIAEGRVQGVGYRWFVQKSATKLGLNGWVRNLPNGTVELEAEGDSEILNRLMEEIKQGPVGAIVQELKVTRIDLSNASECRFDDFEIRT
jgi:acylphosphatase